MNIHFITKQALSVLFTAAMLAVPVQQAWASFELEKGSVILEEGKKRESFNIKNTSSSPMLLVTQLEDIDGSKMSKEVLISPPITRIDPGESQQVNFVLKQGVKLDREVLMRVSFEGVGQNYQQGAQMPIRQTIGFLIQPSSVPVSKTPWKDLSFSYQGNELVINNSGKHVIRLAPQIMLMPGNKPLPLGKMYIMAGETRRYALDSKPSSLVVSPLSRYGFKMDDVTFNL